MSRAGIPAERIERSIRLLRGHKVLLDADLAILYDVEIKVLLQAVRRNPDRFAKDFMFQSTDQEFRNLRSQFVTSSWGGRRYAPCVFTEQGVAMLSWVLNSPRLTGQPRPPSFKRSLSACLGNCSDWLCVNISSTNVCTKKVPLPDWDSQFPVVHDFASVRHRTWLL